jgi:hypothetical protein
LKDGHVQISLLAIHRASQAVQIHHVEEKIFLHEAALPQGQELLVKQEMAQTHVGQGLRR